MQKLLYITDQEEYSERGTIGPLFNDYLKSYLDINMVYVTKYKHSFQRKGDDFIAPEGKTKKDFLGYLSRKSIDLSSYDYIFVRNKIDILENVLKHKAEYSYKVGFRVSYPKTMHIYELIKARREANLFKAVYYSYLNYKKQKLANSCDLFMPSSLELQNKFYPNITTKSFPLYSGLDPKKVQTHKILPSPTKRFIYVGTVDELRQFEVIIDAFDQLSEEDWQWVICSKNREYITRVLASYPEIKEKIEVVSAQNLDEVRSIVNGCDVGIAVLPDIAIFNTTFPAKVLDGYSSAIPAIISNNSKNRHIFTDEESFFSDFDTDSIKKSIQTVLNRSKEQLKEMGQKGQDKLMSLDRNYEIMAKNLYEELRQL